jgi:peptide/nickel transport system permease protein
MLLPAIALAWASLAQESRITRSTMIKTLSSDYILSDLACGFPNRVITFKYALRPSLTPTISIMGPDLAYIIVNAFLVEKVFSWPGFARYGLNVIINKDLNAVMAVVLILGTIFVLANIIADLVNGFIDPRTRLRRGR